jgi:SAM-dependent methyltransferase
MPGDRILDVGSGTSAILSYMPDVRYVGYDPNPKYIEYARKRFANRGEFFAGYFDADELAKHRPFDIGVLTGVLHHLNDSEATGLLGLLRVAIKPGGRLVTLDNVFIENQNPIARKLIEWDRGKNVRTVDEYGALAAVHFETVQRTIIHKKWPPYTLFIMECS